jgi:Holliday junction resolvase
LKLIQTNKPGIPDLLALKQNEVYFVEVKTDKGKASKLQLYRHKELEKFGFKVEIKKQV